MSLALRRSGSAIIRLGARAYLNIKLNAIALLISKHVTESIRNIARGVGIN